MMINYSYLEWSKLETMYDGHLHFIQGECTDVAALEAAHADTADRVLILPYTTWQDYRVCTNHHHSSPSLTIITHHSSYI